MRNNITANNVTGIISGAEAITSKTRKLVEKQFNCKLVSRYSNQGMGILAQDDKEDYILLNRACYYFELLDVDDKCRVYVMGRKLGLLYSTKDEPISFFCVG